jgi:hypothetical protein
LPPGKLESIISGHKVPQNLRDLVRVFVAEMLAYSEKFEEFAGQHKIV